jgi:hypothetical protein
MPLPAHLVAISRAACPTSMCEPELRGRCTAELCEDYQRNDQIAAAKIVHSAALIMLSNDTRIRRTPGGVPCNRLTCQTRFRHWGCNDDLCTNITASDDDEFDNDEDLEVDDEDRSHVDADLAEWIPGRSSTSPLMSQECLQRCITPLFANDMETECRGAVQVCRELLQHRVRAGSSIIVYSKRY